MSSTDWTKISVDFATLPRLLSPRQPLGLEAVGLGIVRLSAGEGATFSHHHDEQEEVYVVLEGAGELLLDGRREPLARGDLVRVGPRVKRALRAADDTQLLVLVAGATPAGWPRDPNARYLIDDGVPHYDELPPWCAGDESARARNAELDARWKRSLERRSKQQDPAPPDRAC